MANSPGRQRAHSQENYVNENDDTLQNDMSNGVVGGQALSQCVMGNSEMGDDETESEDDASEQGFKDLISRN